MSQLANKTALVIGGGTGIGAAIAHALANEGCRVAIAGRRVDVLRQTANQFQAERPIQFHEVDVADRQSVARLLDWLAEQVGPIDILAFCAGINIKHRSMAETTAEEWDQLLAINATGAYNCVAAVLPQMRERRDGVIILVSSVSGRRAFGPAGVGYCASKFALGALGTSIANEEGKNGIRVTTIHPGDVDTPMLDQRPVVVSKQHRANILQPEDIAAAVLMVVNLPPRAHLAEMTIKPTSHEYV